MSDTPSDIAYKKAFMTMVKEAEKVGAVINHATSSKLLYLAHGLCLAKHNLPIAKGIKFDAWRYGPIHERTYHRTKFTKASPVTESMFLVRGWPLLDEANEEDKLRIRCIASVVRQFRNHSWKQLSAITTMKGSPWAAIKDPEKGIRIRDRATKAFFKKHLVTGD